MYNVRLFKEIGGHMIPVTVIERLNNEESWYLYGRTDHEIALILNTLFDIKHNIAYPTWEDELNVVDFLSEVDRDGKEYVNAIGLLKYTGDVMPLKYSDLLPFRDAINLTEWFFEEI